MNNDKRQDETDTNRRWRHRNRLSPPRQRIPLCIRTQLLRSLNLARSCKMSLLIAPAGYGKTTVLSQWIDMLREQEVDAAWCSLSARESDADAFLKMIARSLHFSGINMNDTGLLLDGDINVDAALNAIALKMELSPRSLVIILDEFDNLHGNDAIGLIDEFVELLPPHAHLVLATRSKPTLMLSRLRAQGQARIIEPEELRLDVNEINEILKDCVPEEELPQIAEWTQGWPVAVQMFRLWRESSGTQTISTPSPWPAKPIADYLAEQVFASLAPAQREFLSEIALLEEIDPEAVDFARGADNSLELLQALQLLLPSLIETEEIGEHPVFRLHPLVAESARTSLPLGPQRVAALHSLFSRWFTEHERPIEAIRHAVAADDIEAVGAVIRSLLPLHIFLHSGLSEIKAVAREIPSTFANHPRVELMRALIHFKSGFLQEAAETVSNSKAPENATQSEINAYKIERLALETMFRIYFGDCDESVDHALDQLREMTQSDALMWAWRVNLSTVLHQQRGEIQQARSAIEQCDAIYDIENMRFASFHLQLHRTLLNLAEGELNQVTSELAKLMKQRRAEFTSDVPVLSMARLVEATISYERRPSEALEEIIVKSIDQFGESESWFEQKAVAAAVLADIAFYRGGVSEIEIFAEKWRDWARKIGATYLDPLLSALTARYCLLAGEVKKATALLAPFLDLKAQSLKHRWREREAMLSALSLHALALEQPAQAREHALNLIENARHDGRRRGVISGHVILARIAEAADDANTANAEMLKAVRAAHPDGYVMPFTEIGFPVRYILERLLDDMSVVAIEKQHIELTIRSFTLQPSHNPHDLGRREIEILRHLADGISNKLIARRLGITENTVKFHLKKAFQKLGVTSRRAASAAFEAEREAGCYP